MIQGDVFTEGDDDNYKKNKSIITHRKAHNHIYIAMS